MNTYKSKEKEMNRDFFKDMLVEEYEYDRDEVENMSNDELLNAYLVYNGIIGYTYDIIETINTIYKIDLDSIKGQ